MCQILSDALYIPIIPVAFLCLTLTKHAMSPVSVDISDPVLICVVVVVC